MYVVLCSMHCNRHVFFTSVYTGQATKLFKHYLVSVYIGKRHGSKYLLSGLIVVLW